MTTASGQDITIRGPRYERLIGAGAIAFTACFGLLVLVAGPVASEVSTAETAGVEVVLLAVFVAVLWFQVRTVRARVTVRRCDVLVSSAWRTRTVPLSAIDDVRLDELARCCVIALKDGTHVFCPMVTWARVWPNATRRMAQASADLILQSVRPRQA